MSILTIADDKSAEEPLEAKYARESLAARPLLIRTALNIVRVQEDAEEIADQVVYKGLRALSSFKGQSTISTWLTRFAINDSLILLRKRRNKTFISIDEPDRSGEGGVAPLQLPLRDAGPLEKAVDGELSARVRKALQTLPPKIRAPVLLRMDDRPFAEIAKELSISIPAAKTRVLRGRHLLREQFVAMGITMGHQEKSGDRQPALSTRKIEPGADRPKSSTLLKTRRKKSLGAGSAS